MAPSVSLLAIRADLSGFSFVHFNVAVGYNRFIVNFDSGAEQEVDQFDAPAEVFFLSLSLCISLSMNVFLKALSAHSYCLS